MVLIVAVAAGSLSLLDSAGVFGRRTGGGDVETYHGKTFRVVKVVDGDTVDIDLPDGRWKSTRIRLWGVDTPESVRPDWPVEHFGPEASAFTKTLCAGKSVRVELHFADTRCKYGRLLAYLVLPDGTCLNKRLIDEGYGYADTRYPHPRQEAYKAAMRKARREELGLWKGVTAKDMPNYLPAQFHPNRKDTGKTGTGT
jgi:micrococcal nuclease